MKVEEIMTKDPVYLNGDDGISEAIAKMRDLRIHHLPVVNGNTYLGAINYRELMRRKSVRLKSKARNFAVKTPELSEKQDVLAAVGELKESGLPALPVLRKGKLVGIVSETDIVRNIDSIITADLQVRDIATTDPVLAKVDEDILSAAEKIRGLYEYEIPVVSKEGMLKGILRLDDIMDMIIRDKSKTTVGEVRGEREKVKVTSASIMDNAFSVRKTDSISQASKLMTEKQLHMLPVVDDSDKVVGVIDLWDILEIIETDSKDEGILISISGLTPYETDLYDITYFLASKFTSKFANLTNQSYGKLEVHVMKYHREGVSKYSIRTKLISEPIVLAENYSGWNYGEVLSEIFDAYEKRLKKYKEKGST
ncbi:MAG TPA: CBS domain-containing protein [Thermoplasmataceae archaeon]|nr:CBS domain-containing protein [Thermoplasmataceae archaeon]